LWHGAGLGLERAVAITFIGEGVSAFLVRSLFADLLPPHQHPDGGSPVRFAVEPSPRHGLRKPSQLMVDKLFTVPIEAVGAVVG